MEAARESFLHFLVLFYLINPRFTKGNRSATLRPEDEHSLFPSVRK
jgi:hypothetical protein